MATTQATYSVLVGNLGYVLRDAKKTAAKRCFQEYKQLSKGGYGRVAYEQVSLLKIIDGKEELIKEYIPEESIESEE